MTYVIRADVSDVINVTVDIPEEKAKMMTGAEWSELFHQEAAEIIQKRFPESYVEPWQVTTEKGEEIKAWC